MQRIPPAHVVEQGSQTIKHYYASMQARDGRAMRRSDFHNHAHIAEWPAAAHVAVRVAGGSPQARAPECAAMGITATTSSRRRVRASGCAHDRVADH